MKFVVELAPTIYIAEWSGDPGRTLVRKSARRYDTLRGARIALARARRYRAFPDARILVDE